MLKPSVAVVGPLLAVTLLCAAVAVADDAVQEIGRFRLLLYSGQHIQGSDGVLSETEFTGSVRGRGEMRVARSEIKVLDAGGSSKAAAFAGLGLAAGLLTAGLTILQVEADPYSDVNDDAVVPVTIGLAATGALIGAIIGANSRSWERVPLTPTVGVSPQPRQITCAMQFAF